jgi:hypothetical protein
MRAHLYRTAGSIAVIAAIALALFGVAEPAQAAACSSSSSSTVSRSTTTDRLTVTVYFTTHGYCSGTYFTKQKSYVSKIVATYNNWKSGYTAKNTINAAAVHDRYTSTGPYCSSPAGGSCWLNTSSQYCIANQTCPMTRTYYPGVTISYHDQNVVRIHCVCGGLGFNFYNQYNLYRGFTVNDVGS